MNIIKLNAQNTVHRQGEFGWEPTAVYEPVYLVAEHIESFFSAGMTHIKMRSGEKIIVQESPEEIIAAYNSVGNMPATDTWCREMQARGVEMAIEHIAQTICPNHETVLKEFAQQLREAKA